MKRQSLSSIATTIPALAIGVFAALPAQGAGASLEIFPDERILYLMALFALLVFPVNKLLFRPIFRVLDERDARIEGARRRAAKISAEAEATLDRYREALRGAREEAESERKQVLEVARREQARLTGSVRSESEAAINRAREQVAGALDTARSQLRQQARELAREAAARVLGRSLQ